MALDASAPWHGASYGRFLEERLPELLAARLPLQSYHTEPATHESSGGPEEARVTVALASGEHEIRVEYVVPLPDAEGVFTIDGSRRVVLPLAAHADLATAEIRCVGEQLYDEVAARLGEAPPDLPWSEALLRTWLPLDRWVRDFLLRTGQTHQQLNWLERHAHPRRLRVREEGATITPGHRGRVCPIENPEGPNMGRLLHVATGATICDGAMQIVEDAPAAMLGVTASMIPCLEHSDANRLLMGANMMRQWLVPPDPEPALVQTGNEPDAPDFWCGRNLLTAFVCWGEETFEDAIVISESCAKRLGYPHPIEPGDKLSNRHGSKGIVSRILPDDAMPRLADGTPVELIFHFMGLISRLNFGQVREAVMGRLARVEGRPAIVPPFQAPGEAELRRRLAAAGLREDGMESLTDGASGVPMPRPSTVGWVYWGKLHHVAREKIDACVAGTRGQRVSEAEYVALRDVGAYATLHELFNTRADERPDAATLATRAASAEIGPAGPPAPQFAALVRRLSAGGIRAALDDGMLTLQFAPPEGERLALARPVPHPWARGRMLCEIGVVPDLLAYRAMAEANARLGHLQEDRAPESLTRKAVADLEARVGEFFAALLTSDDLRPSAGVLFSGRAVIAPGADLRLDQVGLPEEIAWTLFGPLVARETALSALGSPLSVKDGGVSTATQQASPPTESREQRAESALPTRALDEIMARSWVILYRPGFFGNGLSAAPAPFLAFHPVRIPERVIRLHSLANNLMDADFDGDLLTVFLPLTAEGQREAGERLSIAGRLARDSGLLPYLCPIQEPVWGLASLARTAEGRQEIGALLGEEVASSGEVPTRAAVVDAAQRLLAREGVEGALPALERLARRGFAAMRESGASTNPFLGSTVSRPAVPTSDDGARPIDLDAWTAYDTELGEEILARTDYDDPDLGPQLLAMKSGARGNLRLLVHHLGAHTVAGFAGEPVRVRHGLCEGLTPDEMFAHAVAYWYGIARMRREWDGVLSDVRRSSAARGFHVLARAMRTTHPGIVFAHAAATGEVDPLTDPDSRLFVGLPPG